MVDKAVRSRFRVGPDHPLAGTLVRTSVIGNTKVEGELSQSTEAQQPLPWKENSVTARRVPRPPRTHLSEALMTAPLPLPIDRNSPVPLYYQLALALEGAIRSGALVSGTRLDNEIELAARLRIGRVTVRSALQRLVDAGLVVRTRRVGTYVTSPHRWARPDAPATV